MTHIVDSDWVVDWLGGREAAHELLDSLRSEGLVISVVTYGEVYEGLCPNPRSQALRHHRIAALIVRDLARQSLLQQEVKLRDDLGKLEPEQAAG